MVNLRKRRIRPLAVCLCREGDRVLVELGRERATRRQFYRAIGGRIEFGERAVDAARREWLEEIGVEPRNLRLLGVVESLFTFEGLPGHEIAFVFDGRLRRKFAADEPRKVIDHEGHGHIVVWVSLDDLAYGGIPLYPSGALELVRGVESPRWG